MSETGPTGPSAAPPDGIPDEATYGTLVEEAFIGERGTPFLVSAKDWQLIRAWRENGIPVDAVIRAIHETFERRRSRGGAGKISSIAYCAHAVEERWEMERRGLVGKGDPLHAPALEEVAPRLARLVERLGTAPVGADGALEPAARKARDRALEKLRAIDPGAGFDDVEERLSSVENALTAALLKSFDDASRAAIEAHVDVLLGEPPVSSEVLDRTRRALLRREVRRRFDLPPLTLFDG